MKILLLSSFLVLVLNDYGSKAELNEIVKRYLEKLFSNLAKISEESSCITDEAFGAICISDGRREQLPEVAEICDLDVSDLRSYNYKFPTTINEEELNGIDEEAGCVFNNLDWFDEDEHFVYDQIKSDLRETAIAANADVVVDDAVNKIGRITWTTVNNFQRSGAEEVLLPEVPPSPRSPTADQQRLVDFMKKYMFMVLINRELETACIASVNGEVLKPSNQRLNEELLSNLFPKLAVLSESDFLLEPEAVENVCLDIDLLDDIKKAAQDCNVDEENVNYLGQINLDGTTPNTHPQTAKDQECINIKLGFKESNDESLDTTGIVAHLDRTVLKDQAESVVQSCLDASDNIDYANIRTFARTGIVDDLVAENGDTNDLSDDEDVQRLVTGISEFYLFYCLRTRIEEACVREANCQLANIGTLHDQCPA